VYEHISEKAYNGWRETHREVCVRGASTTVFDWPIVMQQIAEHASLYHGVEDSVDDGVEVFDDRERILEGDVEPVRNVVEFGVEGLDVDVLTCVV
jgi:hypothetical protein